MRKVLGLCLLFVAASFNTTAQTQNPQTISSQFPEWNKEREIDIAATPIVDYKPSDLIIDEARRRKNNYFDNQHFVLSEKDLNPEISWASVTSGTSISDLPVELSDLIIEGQVEAAQAFLSDDKGGIYSEFTLLITEVIKSAPANQINKLDSAIGMRFGGRVRYPSGQIIKYEAPGLGTPRKSAKYIFFLKKFDEGSYVILTAYENRDNKVIALDGQRIGLAGLNKTQFDNHAGKDWEEFKREVNKASGND